MFDKLCFDKIILNNFVGSHSVQKLAGLGLKHISKIGTVKVSRRTLHATLEVIRVTIQ